MAKQEWYQRNRDRARSYSQAYYQNHKQAQMALAKTRHQERRRLVLEHYSGGTPVCACCGERTKEFLTLDHIDNNGAARKRQADGPARSGAHTYQWIIKNNYPPGFQVLCMNCNCAKAWWGACPHQKRKRIPPSTPKPATYVYDARGVAWEQLPLPKEE